MNGILLVSRKTYSLASKKSVVEWMVKPFELNLRVPHDFEERFVNANLKMKDLRKEFREFDIDWNTRSDIKQAAWKMCAEWDGLSDIVWYSKDLNLALVIQSHAKMPEITSSLSVEELKEKFS